MMGSVMNNLSGVDGSIKDSQQQDIKTLFQTREGYYKNLPAFEYSRPNRTANNITVANIAQNSPQANLPVKISIAHLPDDETYPDRILFNVGRELFFYAFKSIWEAPDLSRPLDRQIHKVQVSAHDINQSSLSAQGCSILIGFVNGSFQICDPRKETHLFNEDKLLDKGRVTCIKWLPGSGHQFLVGFNTGQLFQCDSTLPWILAPPTYQIHKSGEGYTVYTSKGRSARNPVYRCFIGQGSLNAISFSPCHKYLASVSHDGFLRVFLFETMDLLGTAKSYFGGLLCVCWSPDSKFVCCSGEDDLIHIFSLESRKVVARGRGHRSWVTAISFDSMTSCLAADQAPVQAHGGGVSSLPNSASRDLMSQRITTYRFASVGQDTQICLWELTDDIVKQSSYSRIRAGSLIAALAQSPVNALPPATVQAKSNQQMYVKRGMGLIGGRASSAVVHTKPTPIELSSQSIIRKNALGSSVCPKLDEVPLLEPLVCKRIAPERLNDIVFHQDCVLISTQDGVIMTWSRPGRMPPT